MLAVALLGMALPGVAKAQEPPTVFPFPFTLPIPPQPPFAPPAPTPDSVPADPATPADPAPAEPVRPRNDPNLKPITLGGWMSILELTPTLGDEIAANGRLWI